MQLKDIPFGVYNLEEIVPEIHPGTSGQASWKTVRKGNTQIRIVEYSPDGGGT